MNWFSLPRDVSCNYNSCNPEKRYKFLSLILNIKTEARILRIFPACSVRQEYDEPD
jgi:hypothetical protein